MWWDKVRKMFWFSASRLANEDNKANALLCVDTKLYSSSPVINLNILKPKQEQVRKVSTSNHRMRLTS